MKTIKTTLLLTLLVLFTCNLSAQIQAITAEGKKVQFNKDSKSWESIDAGTKQKSVTKVDLKTIKSFSTSKGEMSLAEVKAIYLSNTPDDEITKLVNEIYSEEATCDCTTCQWPSHCTWGSDCSFQRKIPCSWCCQ